MVKVMGDARSGGSKGAGGVGAPPLLAHIFSKSRFFPRVKGIYFVVRTCDK